MEKKVWAWKGFLAVPCWKTLSLAESKPPRTTPKDPPRSYAIVIITSPQERPAALSVCIKCHKRHGSSQDCRYRHRTYGIRRIACTPLAKHIFTDTQGKWHVHHLLYGVPRTRVLAICSSEAHKVEWGRNNAEYTEFGIAPMQSYGPHDKSKYIEKSMLTPPGSHVIYPPPYWPLIFGLPSWNPDVHLNERKMTTTRTTRLSKDFGRINGLQNGIKDDNNEMQDAQAHVVAAPTPNTFMESTGEASDLVHTGGSKAQ